MTYPSNSGNFLTDPAMLQEIKLLWQNAVSALTQAEAVILENDTNENPIFAAFYPSLGKTVQVNQADPGEIEADFASSYEQIIYNEDAAEELVITLVLTEDTFNAALSLISDFLSAASAEEQQPAEEAAEEEDEETQLQAMKLILEAAEIRNKAYKAQVEALEMVAEELRKQRNA